MGAEIKISKQISGAKMNNYKRLSAEGVLQ